MPAILALYMIRARYKNFSFWKCELKPSEHACKYFSIFRNYVLSVSSFRANSRNIIGRNPTMLISLLANQDLTPMLLQYAYCYKNRTIFELEIAE